VPTQTCYDGNLCPQGDAVCKLAENPVKEKAPATSRKVHQRNGDAIVRESDDSVRYYVQPNDSRVPQIAGSMGQEIGGK